MNKQLIIAQARWVRDNCIVIDTETTGLGENDTIVELAAVHPKTREVLIDVLVKPLLPISPEAQRVSGISNYTALYTGISVEAAINLLAAQTTTAYISAFNRAFDARLILQSGFRISTSAAEWAAVCTREADGTTCIMELANRYLHDHLEWDAEQAKFKRLSLEKCLQITGIQREGIAHRALSDALAAADLLNFIAEGR